MSTLPWSLETEQLFHALAWGKACDTLESICVEGYYSAKERSDNSSMAIKQLLCFPQLRTVRVSLQCNILIDNDILLEVMSRWLHICCTACLELDS